MSNKGTITTLSHFIVGTTYIEGCEGMRHSSYLREIFEPQTIVRAFIETIPKHMAKRLGVVFVGTGLSGTAALFILKQAGCINHIGIVRKGSSSHSTYAVELSCDIGTNDCDWVFIDDFISSGRTFRRVLDNFNKDRFLGCMLYHDIPTWKKPVPTLKLYSHHEEDSIL